MHDPSATREFLRDTDQLKANEILKAMADKAVEVGANNNAVMWAIAMAKAAVLARAKLGDEQVWVAERFADLLEVALPTAIIRDGRARPPQ